MTQQHFCRQCGKQINGRVRFCPFCGCPSDAPEQPAGASNVVYDNLQANLDTARRAAAEPGNNADAAVPAAAVGVRVLSKLKGEGYSAAPETAGEIVLGSFGGSRSGLGQTAAQANAAVTGIRAQAEEILSPVRTLLSGAKSLLSGIVGMIKNPKSLIPVLVMATLWIVLPLLQWRGTGGAVVKLLSWLTFAEGGVERDGLGVLGGIVGKGGTAVALGSLFSGGLKSALGGIRSLFSKKRQGGSAALLLIGAAAGIAIDLFCVGAPSASATMAGISGALLSLQALGGRSGFLYSVAESLTAGKTDGVRVAQDGKIASLLGGSALGFGAVTAISAIL